MLNLDEDGNYSLDHDKMNAKIKKYVKKLAEEVDTLGKERSISYDFRTGCDCDRWKLRLEDLTESRNQSSEKEY